MSSSVTGGFETTWSDRSDNGSRAGEPDRLDRFVQMSALGADPDGPTAYIRAKGEAEQIVTESVLDWTIFRPSVIFGAIADAA